VLFRNHPAEAAIREGNVAVRVIGGTARGRKLKAPSGGKTRPTSDRVREAVFNVISRKLEGARVLDLFAGSGAMGIEALSRGAERAVFVESGRKTTELIRENLVACGFEKLGLVIRKKLPGGLDGIMEREGPFEIVFMDPPYEKGLAAKALAELARTSSEAAFETVVVEHSRREKLPENEGRFERVGQRKYGTTHITVYERKS